MSTKNKNRILPISFSTETTVHPIRIPTPFAVGDVYSYLIADEKNVLVDCGHKSETTETLLKQAFKDNGLAFSDLDEIWLTHGHPDHFGMAAELANRTGARVVGHPKERVNFAGNTDGDLFETFFRRHDIPSPLIQKMVEQLDWLQQYQDAIEPDWVTDGDRLSIGELDFLVRHTPGHAPGHLTFYSDVGLVFSGDVLLKHISTNALLNFDPDTEVRNKSLLQYRESLKWISRLKGRVLPGHGEIIDNIEKVTTEHLRNQEKRYVQIQKLLADRSRSLFELSEVMFEDAMKEGAIFLVLSEVMGYLDRGLQEGIIVEQQGNPPKYHLENS